MSCHSGIDPKDLPSGPLMTLGHEGFRLFFVLSALHVVLWPLLWVLLFGFDLPLAQDIPPALWHANEMLVGAFGAALIGFLTTAAPEWTDTEPLRGRPLWGLAALWGIARMVGLFGWDGAVIVAMATDLIWMGALVVYLLRLSWLKRTDRLLPFVFWLLLLSGATALARVGFLTGDIDRAQLGLTLVGLGFLGVLGLALGRITSPVANLVLDPTERTSPFRPHPGRLNLVSGLIVVVMAGEIAGLSAEICAYLWIAAGAAFLDRTGECFIGREALRAEILMLGGSSTFAGAGMIVTGCAALGADWGPLAGLHLAYMGGLGLGVYAVFCIAGRMHAGFTLGQDLWVRIGGLALVGATILRVLPEFGLDVPGPLHTGAVTVWALACGLWLIRFWPLLSQFHRDLRDLIT